MKEELDEILELLINGNWTDAEDEFKKLNCSAREFGEFIANLDVNYLQKITFLGFYTRGEK